MTIIKEIVDCIFDENHMLDWDHTEIVELKTFAKQILGKVPKFELVPLVEFVDGNNNF